MSSFSLFYTKKYHCALIKVIPGDRLTTFVVHHYYQQRHVSWYCCIKLFTELYCTLSSLLLFYVNLGTRFSTLTRIFELDIIITLNRK